MAAVGFVVWFIIAVIMGEIARSIGDSKGQKGCFLYGFILGLLGILVTALLPNKYKQMNLDGEDKYDKMKKLYELKEKNIISEEEYEKEKNKIIG